MVVIARDSRGFPHECEPIPHLTQKEDRSFLKLAGLLESFAVALTH